MVYKFVRPFDIYRSLLPFLGESSETSDLEASYPSGLTIYEDKNQVVIEAAVPGIPAKNLQLSYQHGYVVIEGGIEEEEEAMPERKYYRKACHSFSYRVPVPTSADESQEPHATIKNGIMTVKFHKGRKEGKTIPIREEK